MRVSVLVMAAARQSSALPYGLPIDLTAYLQLAPQQRLALLRRRRCPRSRPRLRRGRRSYLARMHEALGLEARQALAILAAGADAGARREVAGGGLRGGARTGTALAGPICALLLQLPRYALDGNVLDDGVGGGGEQAKHGEGAVLLVLREASPEAVD